MLMEGVITMLIICNRTTHDQETDGARIYNFVVSLVSATRT